MLEFLVDLPIWSLAGWRKNQGKAFHCQKIVTYKTDTRKKSIVNIMNNCILGMSELCDQTKSQTILVDRVERQIPSQPGRLVHEGEIQIVHSCILGWAMGTVSLVLGNEVDLPLNMINLSMIELLGTTSSAHLLPDLNISLRWDGFQRLRHLIGIFHVAGESFKLFIQTEKLLL